MKNLAIGFVIVFGTVVGAGAASAQEDGRSRPNLVVPFGMSVAVGAGVSTFAQSDVRDATGTAGSWDARFAFGTRLPVAVEAAYLGSVQSIDAIGLDSDAVLLGQGIEGSVRVNVLKSMWQPYVLVGAAWKHYDITRASTNTSDIADNDDVFEVPLGLGVGYRYRGLLLDARAVYRTAFDDELLQARAAASSSNDDLHTFGANITAGYEF